VHPQKYQIRELNVPCGMTSPLLIRNQWTTFISSERMRIVTFAAAPLHTRTVGITVRCARTGIAANNAGLEIWGIRAQTRRTSLQLSFQSPRYKRYRHPQRDYETIAASSFGTNSIEPTHRPEPVFDSKLSPRRLTHPPLILS
jgi:hypothetical protein